MSYICAACVGEPVLQQALVTGSKVYEPCEYCDNDTAVAEIFAVAAKCAEVIKTFYEVSSLTMSVVHFNRPPAGSSLEELIAKLTGIPERAAVDTAECLISWWHDDDSGENLYGEDPYFVLRRDVDSPFVTTWTDVEISLRTEARYVNPKVGELLGHVFSGLETTATADGQSVLVDAGPGTSFSELYRARVFQSEDELHKALQHPESSLGAPPAGVGKSGRMNAAGLPAFYGALDRRTAISEVRPAVGSWVASARFKIARPLKLLDLQRLQRADLKPQASLFDATTLLVAQRLVFLRALAAQMSLPVMPDQEDHNYLVTQVVADYLAMLPRIAVDGIVYPSVQRGRKNESPAINVVLFHKSAITAGARSETPTAVADLRVFVDEAPGSYFDPEIMALERNTEPTPWLQPGPHPKPSLKLEMGAIELHRIQAVEFDYGTTAVALVAQDPRRR